MTNKRKSVYVMVSGIGAIKIGISSDPERRRRTITASTGIPIRVVYNTVMTDLALAIEREAHQRLAKTRVAGEWFQATEEEAVAAVMAAVVSIKKRSKKSHGEDRKTVVRRNRDWRPTTKRRAEVIGRQITCMINDAFGDRKQWYAASRIGISQAYLSDIISGKRSISPETALSISRVFGSNIGEDLFLRQVEMELSEAKMARRRA